MTKVELFEKDLQKTAEIFKALGHPARLSILKYLAETKSCITGDISDSLPLSRTTVNQHLSELKKYGLIKGTVNGVKVNYCLDHNRMEMIREMFDFFMNELNTGFDREC